MKVCGYMSDPIDRILDAVQAGKSIIKNREILREDYEPDIIQYRDSEQEEITQSLSPILLKSRASNLILYGEPGTGKTLVIKKIIKNIEKRVEKSNFPINVAYSNSKNETAIYGLIVSLGRQLDLSEKVLPTTGLSISEVLKRILKKINEDKLNIIFVIDEIDDLAEQAQKTGNDILYQLTRVNERLEQGSITLVGISNNLTFKEKLDPRVISSLSEKEVLFTNYDIDQIKTILRERIKEAFVENAVEESALELCAILSGQEHGDARRAIDLLLKAGEIADQRQLKKVTHKHVREAFDRMEEQLVNTALKGLALHKKIVVIAIIKAKGSTTGEIYLTYKNLCKLNGRDELTNRRVTQMLSDIELSGLISGRIINQGSHGSTKKFELKVEPKKAKTAFKESKDGSALQDIL